MHKNERLPNKLSGSNWTQIGLKMCQNADSLLLGQYWCQIRARAGRICCPSAMKSL